jgi:dihydroorotase
MNPPLRGVRDREAIREGLKDGTLDAISTDHAPHSPDEKNQEFDRAPFGIIGLETALPLSLSLVSEGVLSLPGMLSLLTENPARILKIGKGTLETGSVADLVMFDPEEEWIVDSSRFKSKSRNTPFQGWKVKGRVKKTLVAGKVVFQEP